MDSSFRLKSFSLVPPPLQGVNMDTRKRVQLHSTGEAIDLFNLVARRLLDINKWNELEGLTRPQYALFDMNGDPKTDLAEEGDYIRLNLPAPHLQNGSRYDWVRIERIVQFEHKERNTIAIRVRPAADPTLKGPLKNKQTAHFYTNHTTNTFMAERNETTVTVGIHPRNEILNTQQANGFYNQVRNVVVGVMAWLGISKNQWKMLIEGLLHEE